MHLVELLCSLVKTGYSPRPFVREVALDGLVYARNILNKWDAVAH